VLARRGGRALGLFPLLRERRRLRSLTTRETCAYAPALAAGLTPEECRAVLTGLVRFCRTSPVTRLDALPADADWLSGLRAAAGACALPFEHFGNWHEDVAGRDWAGYLAARPGALRETIRRRVQKAEALAGADFTILTRPEEMDRAAAAYEFVYARSWKTAEPFPAFNAALIRAMADSGWLRLGIWSLHGQPVAAQFWVVRRGGAIVLKLAHDEAFRSHSPGTVLTALMLRHLLDREHVTEIDFGRGDDAYKQGWAACRRQRMGLLLVNPLRPAGAAALLRQAVGRARRRAALNEAGSGSGPFDRGNHG
jgi:CelD/BcsL family acetyltransferase involved in cellulose biosynthesis